MTGKSGKLVMSLIKVATFSSLLNSCLPGGVTLISGEVTGSHLGDLGVPRVFLNNTCNPSNATNVEEACDAETTLLICSEESQTCVCQRDKALPGGNSDKRRINMEWVAELSQCQGSPESGCDSAGDSAGQITCVPGYLCIHVLCEKDGNGACMKMQAGEDPTYDTSQFCGTGSGRDRSSNFEFVFLSFSMILLLFAQ